MAAIMLTVNLKIERGCFPIPSHPDPDSVVIRIDGAPHVGIDRTPSERAEICRLIAFLRGAHGASLSRRFAGWFPVIGSPT
jgi:hypothetical protein